MKKIIILIGIMVFGVSCQNNYDRPTFFVNMAKLSEFDNVDDKSELKGFDRIQLIPINKKKQNIPCWFLSTPKNGYFNIDGILCLRNRIVYISTSKNKSFNIHDSQILFNFNNVDSTWTVNYNGEGFPPYLEIHKEGSHYNSEIKDSTSVFRVQKHLKNCSWIVNEFLVEISLKYGFATIVYLDKSNKNTINFLPIPKFSKKPYKANLNKLE